MMMGTLADSTSKLEDYKTTEFFMTGLETCLFLLENT